jgi:hypothetical protein
MIIVGSTSYSESSIRSIAKLQSGYRVEFTDRPSKTVFDIPSRAQIIPASAGSFELWAVDPDGESFDRHTVIAWQYLTEMDGSLIGRPEPLCAAGALGDDFPRAHCVVVDKGCGQAWGLGLDDCPTADLESLTREILDKARADRAPKRRAA